MPFAELLSLPAIYNTPFDVNNVDWGGFPGSLKHKPFVYVAKEQGVRCSMGVIAPHGLGGFYTHTGTDMVNDPVRVNYQKIISTNLAGCMVHAIREIPREPVNLQAAITDNGSTGTVVVRTTHADDASTPPFRVPYQPGSPFCHLEHKSDQIVFHCLLYLEGSGIQIDRSLAAQATWQRHLDPQGNFLDWHLVIPVLPGNQYKLQYVAFTADRSIGINPGDVLRVQLAPKPGTNGNGRSFGTQWP